MFIMRKINAIRRVAARRKRELEFPYTAVMRRHRALFIHIPRTGGTSIWAAMGETPYWRQHEAWHTYAAANPRRFQDYWKFAIVRHPVDRAYSAFKYLEAGGNQKSDLAIVEQIQSFGGFNGFVRKGLLGGGFGNSLLFLPQTFFICDQTNAFRCDFVGRFEDMTPLHDALRDRLSISVAEQPRLNVRQRGHSENISDESRAIIKSIYARDFRLLEYDSVAQIP